MNEFNSHKEQLMKLAAKRYPLKGVSCASERNKRIGLRAAFIRRMMAVAFPEKANNSRYAI